MLKAIEDTSIETLVLIKEINLAINMTIEEIKIQLPRIYSKELVELLFFEFYTKISYIQNSLNVSRRTASDYLINLEKNGFLFSEKIGKEKIYINKKLFDIVQN
jgi:Fic family protein